MTVLLVAGEERLGRPWAGGAGLADLVGGMDRWREVAGAGWWAGSGGDPEEEGTGGVAAARWDRWDKAPRI